MIKWHENTQTSPVVSLALNGDQSRLVSCNEDGTATIWQIDGLNDPTNLATFKYFFSLNFLIILRAHSKKINRVQFSPDGKRMITGSDDRSAKVWDVNSHTELLNLQNHKDGVSCVTFSADGSKIATGSFVMMTFV